MFKTCQNIRQIRLSRGMSQKELAQKMGLSQTTVSQFERGTHLPSFKTVTRLARAFDCDPADIYDPGEYPDIPATTWGDLKAQTWGDLQARTGEKIKALSDRSLLDDYKKLNSIGRKIAKERIKELCEIERYTRPDIIEESEAVAGKKKKFTAVFRPQNAFPSHPTKDATQPDEYHKNTPEA